MNTSTNTGQVFTTGSCTCVLVYNAVNNTRLFVTNMHDNNITDTDKEIQNTVKAYFYHGIKKIKNCNFLTYSSDFSHVFLRKLNIVQF